MTRNEMIKKLTDICKKCIESEDYAGTNKAFDLCDSWNAEHKGEKIHMVTDDVLILIEGSAIYYRGLVF